MSLFFLAIFFLQSGSAHAQVITEVALSHRSDVLPSQVTSVDLHAVIMLPSWSSIDARYRVQFMKQDSANFLKASSAQLHELRIAYAFALFGGNAMMHLEPLAFLRASDAPAVFPGYGVSLDAKLLNSEAADIACQASNHHGLLASGLFSIENGILYNDVSLHLASKWLKSLLLTMHAKRSFLSDGNVLDEVFAYLLYPVFHDPDIRIGYAFQYANAREDRWQETGSEYAASTETYRYGYFYFPYFTPLYERGHNALGSIQYSPCSWMSVTVKASIPLYSRAARIWFAPEGWTPQAQSDGYCADESKVVQAVLSGSIQFELTRRSWLGLSVERFNKPYYAYSEGTMKYTQAF